MVFKSYLNTGFIVRIIVSILLLVLPIDYRIKTIAIFATDFIDCAVSKLLGKIDGIKNYFKMCKTYRYQSIDKAVDLLTYFILYLYFGLSPLYLYIIILRFVGISLFYLTLNSHWLMICPDLFKEVLLYDWFIARLDATNFTIIFIAKIIFEYIWHTYQNNTDYKNSIELFKIKN